MVRTRSLFSIGLAVLFAGLWLGPSQAAARDGLSPYVLSIDTDHGYLALPDLAALAADEHILAASEPAPLQPDDKTFAKINRVALAPCAAWQVSAMNGVWRRQLE